MCIILPLQAHALQVQIHDSGFVGQAKVSAHLAEVGFGRTRSPGCSGCFTPGFPRSGHSCLSPTMTIHEGLHSCASHLIGVGMSLAETRQFLGHANVFINGLHTHAVMHKDAPRIAAFDDARTSQRPAQACPVAGYSIFQLDGAPSGDNDSVTRQAGSYVAAGQGNRLGIV